VLIVNKNIIMAFIHSEKLDYKFYRNAVQINSFLKDGNPDIQLRLGIVIDDPDPTRIGCWNDWVANEKGMFIKLVKLYYGCNWQRAEQRLMALGASKIAEEFLYKSTFTIPDGITIWKHDKAMRFCTINNISDDIIIRKNLYVSTDGRSFLKKFLNKIIVPTIKNNNIVSIKTLNTKENT